MSKHPFHVWAGTVPLRGQLVPVYQPIVRRAHVCVTALNGRFGWLNVDDGGMLLVHRMLMLAASRPDSIVHLPRFGTEAQPLRGEGPLDLVICQPSLQLRRSHWKEMRTASTHALAERWMFLSIPIIDTSGGTEPASMSWPAPCSSAVAPKT